jgi:hypothetical protein
MSNGVTELMNGRSPALVFLSWHLGEPSDTILQTQVRKDLAHPSANERGESRVLTPSEREDAEFGERRGKALNVFRISGSNDSRVELKRRCDNECVNLVIRI